MFVEKRISGKNTKYYLSHSYRDETNKVIKIRKFLGTNLTKEELEDAKKFAKITIHNQIKEIETNIFNFSLTPKEIQALNKYNEKIKISHFDEKKWNLFTEEFTYNTNAIEGSTVLKEDVPSILQKKQNLNSDEIETKGVAKAIEFIRTTKQELSISLILKLHKFCFEGSKEFAGQFRKLEVVIKARDGTVIHKGTPANELILELEEFIKWYKKNKSKFKPLILAAIIHNQFEYMHPFQDGNGRVGRLLLNYILIKNNYPPINIALEDRSEYYWVLYEYSQNDKLRPTIQFLIKQYKKTFKKIK
ncbi:Fic family protein [Candidatus Woesearchaeota archaeon]|nr:Fic family protein [Candidatus Woesearchaeota archaeon]